MLFLRFFIVLWAILTVFGKTTPAAAAPVFSVSGFVDEEVYRGNGMISLRFDAAGRMWVIEKQGRILVFEPNPAPNSSFTYEYFHKPDAAPNWTTMPDFSSPASATLIKSGVTGSFSLEPRERADFFAFRYSGNIAIPTAGSYTFYLASDDGSRLYIDNNLVVDHNGLHGASEKSGTVTLAEGNHTIRVEFFEANGGESLSVQYSGPGLAKGPVATGPFKAPSVFADIISQVETDGETGLTGMALDPDFANNHYLYVIYATNTDQHISRFTANASFTAAVPGSETVLLSGLPNTNSVHKAGDMAFHPNDPNNLYIMIGDDGNRNLVGNLGLYNGKILKISASDGKGLPGNPHYDGNVNSVASRIWSARYRNPFRFAFDPAAPINDVLYISENGDGTDRLARIQKGADGGWDNQFTISSGDGKRKVLETSDPSKTAVAILRGGPFAPDGAPVLYNARYGGGTRNEVRRWALTGPNLDQLTPLAADAGNAFYRGFEDRGIVDFEAGPDGALYYTDSGQGASTGTGFRIGRIRFVGGSSPVADFTAAPASGPSPLNVAFSDASAAPGSTLASWNWSFGDGAVSSQQNPSHVYAQPGIYTVSLTVANLLGLTKSKELEVKAYAQTTVQLSGQIVDGRTLPGSNLAVATELRFYQKDGITPLPFAGGTGSGGNVLTVNPGGTFNASLAVQITGDGMVVSAGEPAEDGMQAAFVGIPLSTAAANQNATAVFRLSDTLLRGQVRDTQANPARVDVGVSRGSQNSYYAFAGGRDFLPGSGLVSSGVLHRTVPDALGYYHVPVPTGGGNADFYLDTTADSLVATHGKVRRNVTVNSGQTAILDLTIGLYDGGTGEADLSGIAETPNVNFAAQIQPIFNNSCVACHNDIATNSKGLDLQAGASLLGLVNKESTEASGVKLVEPGAPERSYLMEKINAAAPQAGTSMRPGDPMSLAQRALIRDWIRQLDPAGKIQFVSAGYTVQEGGGNVDAVITVARSGNSAGAVGVTVSSIAGGSATAGSDYTGTVAQLSWADGETGNKTLTIPVLADTLAEGSETVFLALSAPSGGAMVGEQNQATLILLDRPFDAWRLQYFGAAANNPPAQPGADFDSDGISNLVEYALNSNPVQAGGGPWVVAVDQNRLQISFTRNLSALGLIYRVEGSDTLEAGSWEVLATRTGTGDWTKSAGGTVTDNAATGAVSAKDSVTVSSRTKRFLRLTIERTTD